MGKRIQIILGFLLLAFAVWMTVTSNNTVKFYLNRVENIAYDMQLHTRLFEGKPNKKSTITIIDIDDKSLSEQGRWPWPRAKLSTLIDNLSELGAVVVVLDLTFPEVQSNINFELVKALEKKQPGSTGLIKALKKLQPMFDDDTAFSKSLKNSEVVLGMAFMMKKTVMTGEISKPVITLSTPEEKALDLFQAHGYVANIPLLQNSAKSHGFMNVFTDDDGVIRKQPLLIRYGDKLYPSLAFEAARLFSLSEKISLVTKPYGKSLRLEGIKFGKQIIPTDEHGRVLIPFRGGSGSFTYVSASDVLNKKLPPDALQGELVFVGTSAAGLGDLHTTAIQGAFPGVEIHANIAEGILSDNFPHKPSWAEGAELAEVLFVGIALIFLFSSIGPRVLALLTVLTPIVLIFVHNFMWEYANFILSPLIPILFILTLSMMNLSIGYLFESRRREHIKQMFGQYVPLGHIDHMLKESGSYGLHGEDREMTVLFADIRNFTNISEFLSASDVKELLNEFFTPMTQVVFDHQGTIDKYVGDMLMAFWGAPLKDENHTQHALGAALDMQIALRRINTIFAERKWSRIQIGIGLNSGMMSVGDMGSKFHRNYTVLGDAVNLASRLESLTKYYGVGIIASQYTHDDQEEKFFFRHLDRVRVVGKKSSFDIYEVICRSSEVTESLRDEIKLSDQALNEYFRQQWSKAKALFQQLSENHPQSIFYRLYLNRIANYEQNPPSSSWQGVYDHAKK